jgi:predicted hydrocarbon binding protein
MKGLIFNLLEEFLVARCGETEYELILTDCQLCADPSLMVGPGSYPDQDFTAIIASAAKRLGLGSKELLHEVGRAAIPRLVSRYPQFFIPSKHPRDFFASLNFIHHLEVKKLYKDAELPRFRCENKADGSLLISYISGRGLCHLFSGLINGVADHYQTPLSQRQLACICDGQPECLFAINFDDITQ